MIYMDNAATTKIRPEVYEAIEPYLKDLYANPSSIYTFAAKTAKDIEAARNTVADFLGAKSNEIYFTAGGSESDNWALKSVAFTM